MQRPLWASTGTKNPDYPDTLYVEQVIGPSTVNTMPEKTIHVRPATPGAPQSRRSCDVALCVVDSVWKYDASKPCVHHSKHLTGAILCLSDWGFLLWCKLDLNVVVHAHICTLASINQVL